MENNELIKKALTYAKENALKSDISAADIAAGAGFSIDYFNRIFLSHTGFTVMAYVNYIRLQKAQKLLRWSDQTVLDIALDVGFDSHEGFTKAFKRTYGITPTEYRNKMKDKVATLGEMIDKSVVNRFVHDNKEFKILDSDIVVDQLILKNMKKYINLCMNIKTCGLGIVAPEDDIEKGFIAVGSRPDDSVYLTFVTEDTETLVSWLKRFSGEIFFYYPCDKKVLTEMLKKYGFDCELKHRVETVYLGEPLRYNLPDNIDIRPLCGKDRDAILKWANGKTNGYIMHLLNEKHYYDDSILEFGVFENGELIAIAESGVDTVNGIRIGGCGPIRFADGKQNDKLYREIYSFVTNELLRREVIPFDDSQHGEYAKTHGNFTSVELGFEVVNHSYTVVNKE